jgi:site-specific recombinase XerD
MASMGWEKTGKRWRVFWHVTLPDGSVDKGSKSFKVKKVAQSFKKHCEKREQVLKRSEIVEPFLLDDAVNHWEDFCQGYTDRTSKLYIPEVQRFMTFLPISVVYITDLTKFHINSYLNSLMSRGLVNKTVNNSMCAIKSLCRYIHENHGIENPAAGIKKLKEDPPDVNFISQEQYEAVLKSCPDVVHQWVVFLANTGLRATEMCGLRWRNFDLEQRVVTVVGKGRKRRTVGLNNAAMEVLEQVKDGRKVRATDLVFLAPGGWPLAGDVSSSLMFNVESCG